MQTVDTLLHLIVDNQDFLNNFAIDQKIRKTLISLSRQLKKGFFFTEKQGKLLINLLHEIKKEKVVKDTFNLDMLENPTWSKEFRIIEVVRKIYFDDDKRTNFIVEFTFDKEIRRKIHEAAKKTSGCIETLTHCKFLLPSTEKNIAVVIDAIITDNFQIDEPLLNFYHDIKKIQEKGIDDINGLLNQKEKIIECIKDEIKQDVSDLDLILLDRRIRYQYTYEHKDTNNSLTFKIANRKNSQVWVDSKSYQLEEIFNSLVELNRLPVLIVFNKQDIAESFKKLEILKNIANYYTNLEIGIYFRADNTSDINKAFNQNISDNNFNKFLNDETNVVGLSSTHLPKFMLKTKWYPRSVISFTNSFRQNKTATYCNAVDLVLYHTEHTLLSGTKDEIV
jgi:hypothetical protein